MREDDASYFRRRAIQEQVAAQVATCNAARLRHEELAIMYRFRAAMLSNPAESWAEGAEQEAVIEQQANDSSQERHRRPVLFGKAFRRVGKEAGFQPEGLGAQSAMSTTN